MQAALEHSLPEPLRYFHVLICFTILTTLAMMFTPLRLLVVYHNPHCVECAREVEVNGII